MEYKGFIGQVVYDDEAKVFSGDVLNTRAVITFTGTSVKEIEKAFRASVDDYIAWCEADGVEPEKPYSGKFNVRLAPELHRQVALAAQKGGISINAFVTKALRDELNVAFM